VSKDISSDIKVADTLICTLRTLSMYEDTDGSLSDNGDTHAAGKSSTTLSSMGILTKVRRSRGSGLHKN
jgi:hypothetical protein